MSTLPAAVSDAIEALSDLQGIGSRSAERLVLTLLRNQFGLDKKIGNALIALKENVAECGICCHLCNKTDAPQCGLCSDACRDATRICVVSEPSDVIALERTHAFKGLYHVLHGVISPMDRVRPEDLRIGSFLARVKAENPSELIFALPASVDGETTTLYLIEQIKNSFAGTITRLARGIPSGGDLDYLDAATLSQALTDRRSI